MAISTMPNFDVTIHRQMMKASISVMVEMANSASRVPLRLHIEAEDVLVVRSGHVVAAEAEIALRKKASSSAKVSVWVMIDR